MSNINGEQLFLNSIQNIFPAEIEKLLIFLRVGRSVSFSGKYVLYGDEIAPVVSIYDRNLHMRIKVPSFKRSASKYSKGNETALYRVFGDLLINMLESEMEGNITTLLTMKRDRAPEKDYLEYVNNLLRGPLIMDYVATVAYEIGRAHV